MTKTATITIDFSKVVRGDTININGFVYKLVDVPDSYYDDELKMFGILNIITVSPTQ